MSERTERLFALAGDAAARGRVVITGHDGADVDSAAGCVLMQRLLAARGIPAVVALHAPDRQSRRVMARFGVDVEKLCAAPEETDSLILVDHHRTQRAGRVIACVDHHPTDYPPDYPYVQIEPCGASAVMALRLMQEAGIAPAQQDEALAVTALYLDTIALRSAKVSPEEAEWGRSEAARLGLDVAWLEREGMGLRDMTLPPRELAMLGKKVYDFSGVRVLSTYIQTNAMTEEILESIFAVLREEIIRECAALWVYLVHDPMAMRSVEYDLSPDGSVTRIAYDYLASRGKDVMPRVEREMRKAGK